MAQRLGNVAVGGIVKLKENGSPKNYIVVHQGLPGAMYDASCNWAWLLRQDLLEKREFDSEHLNDYATSDIHAWLNSAML